MNKDYKLMQGGKEESEAILKTLINYNKEHVDLPGYEPKELTYVVNDNQGKFMGGIHAKHFLGILYIELLAIEKEYYGKSLGSLLLEHVEKIAKTQGCSMVYLDTFDFQAPDFYLKHNYEIFGVLEDCPPGHKRYFLTKKLNSDE